MLSAQGLQGLQGLNSLGLGHIAFCPRQAYLYTLDQGGEGVEYKTEGRLAL